MKRIVLSLLIVLGVFTGATAQKANMDARKLQLALFAISNLYVDSTSETKLVEDAIVGMLDKLDPHSNYMDPEETKEMTEPLQGNFDGIGIQFNMLTDTLYVIQVIPGGPSEKVGLMAGDRIIQVDDTLIAGVKMKTTDIMKKLRGPKGTEVRVKVKRGKSPELMDFKIVRGKIPVYSLDAAYMADKNTGYIKLNRFAASSADEFREALEKLRKQGMKNLILDLQGNGGGYLNIAIELADEFLDKNRLIVYTKGSKQPREEANSTARGQFQEGRLVVLVDESSASASEIVSGAIQDWDRGVIVGRRTFGKGLVQKPIPLPDGSMIRLTVSRYYTPTGRCIQKPYENGKMEEYHHDLIDRYNRGELMSADSIHFPDSMRYNTLVSERTVYGGGGIMPDVFIPVDTTRYTDYHRKLVASGLVNRVSMNYLDRNRNQMMAKYPKFQQYKQDFVVGEGRLVVLVDESSASASEIVSGAIQDWDRGVIVGRRTFGKGLVQKPIPLPDGSMIRLTVSRYYTPTGRCIQKPYENGKMEEYHHDLIDRYNRGELMSADSIHFPDSMRYNTLVSERTVYGGGGIMPDVFIPVDTTRYTDYHRKLVASGLVNRVSMNYLDRNRNQMMAKYPKFQQYKQDFVVGEDIMEELLKMAGDEKIEFEEEQYNRSKPLIMLQIKALIARDLYDMAQYFQIINDDNPSYQKALQIINNKETYNRLLGR